MPPREGKYRVLWKAPEGEARYWRDRTNEFGWFLYGSVMTLAQAKAKVAQVKGRDREWGVQIIRVG